MSRAALGLALVSAVLAACGSGGPGTTPPAPSTSASTAPMPSATCGGIKILIEGALPCDRIVAIALDTLARRAPEQLALGVTTIDVLLSGCPVGEMPPQIDCTGARFAQMVTVAFGPAPAGVFIESSLTVAIEPVSGRVLGIENPLIR